jgi:membrane associated rhomboid family serine protease
MTVLLIAVLTGAFAAQWLLELIERDRVIDSGDWLRAWLALDDGAVAQGQWWKFVTFGLLHAGPLHLLGNLLLLYFAGREIEPIYGRRHLLALFLGANIVGGLVQSLLLPGVPLLGVSAGVAALVAAYATTLPELEVRGHIFFLVPFQLRAKFFGLAVLALGGLCWLTHTALALGPAAVVFAGCMGWAYARQLGYGNPFWWQRLIFERRQRERRLARMTPEQFVAEEMDPILEKIAREGMASLTRAERRVLAQGSAKVAARRTPPA